MDEDDVWAVVMDTDPGVAMDLFLCLLTTLESQATISVEVNVLDVKSLLRNIFRFSLKLMDIIIPKIVIPNL